MLTLDKKEEYNKILKQKAPFEVFNYIVEKILCPNFANNIGILLADLFENRLRQKILYTQLQYSALKIHKETELDVKQQFDIIIKHIKDIKKDAKYKNIYVDFILDIPRGNAIKYDYFNSYIDDIINLQRDGEYIYYIRGIGIGGRS